MAPIREVKDNAYITGFNSGASASPQLSAKPWLLGPRLEPYDQIVLDVTYASSTSYASTSFAPIGKLMVEQMSTSNTGGAYYVQSTSVAQALGQFHYGVVVSPGNANANNASGLANQAVGFQSQCRITCVGDVPALVTTTSIACAPATPLVADGNGQLTPASTANTAPGLILATAKGSLSTNLGPSLINVTMGGY